MAINCSVGVVIIGRNEGDRLRHCLNSVARDAACVVYVDSGSTDGSVGLAELYRANVLCLDMRYPFTAARARNEGFRLLEKLLPGFEFVQFVDGDCVLAAGWLEKAQAFLDLNSVMAVVCGRRRERFPERSIYNLLCDLEWDTPVGEAKACGGDALMRVEAFKAVGGYRADLIAGEEPELCVRLRGAGWKVWRIDAEMTYHDAAIFRFGQWWRRSVRSGHAYAEGAHLHGSKPEQHGIRESRRIWAWALGVPLASMAGTAVLGWGGLCLLIAYPLQVMRLALKGKRSVKHNWIYALFIVLAKFPELQGQFTFWWRKLGAGKTALIEYK